MKPEPHWRIVVRADQPELFARLSRAFAAAPLVEIILDRRRGERRRGGSVKADRRRQDRRRPPPAAGYRLAGRIEGCQVYEADRRVPAECPRCGSRFTFDMPRFGEPPARLDLDVIHEETRSQHVTATVRHIVEAHAYSASGRPLLSCRIAGTRGEIE